MPNEVPQTRAFGNGDHHCCGETRLWFMSTCLKLWSPRCRSPTVFQALKTAAHRGGNFGGNWLRVFRLFTLASNSRRLHQHAQTSHQYQVCDVTRKNAYEERRQFRATFDISTLVFLEGSSWLRDAQERSARTALMNRGEGVFCQLDLARVTGHLARRSALISSIGAGFWSASRRATARIAATARRSVDAQQRKRPRSGGPLSRRIRIRPRGSHRARA